MNKQFEQWVKDKFPDRDIEDLSAVDAYLILQKNPQWLHEELKICTGCGRYNDDPLGLNPKGEPYLACCPGSHYIPVKEYIINITKP